MEKELSSQKDPLDANLEKVIPSLHEWHRINTKEVTHLKQAVCEVDEKMSDVHTKIDSGFSQIQETLMSNKAQVKQELAGTFLEIAKHLVKDAGGQLSASTTLLDIVGPCRMILEEPVGASNAAQGTSAASPTTVDGAVEHQLYRMKQKHLTLLGLLQEWYGTGDYYDGYGGIAGRNEDPNCKKWKTHCCINQMQYSRTERTVKAVEEYARLNSIDDRYLAAEKLQPEYERCKCSVANFVNWAKDTLLLPKGKPRGRSKKATTATTANA
jgi:hypothetical protein